MDVNRIKIDSRIITLDDIYLPIVGENMDGHDYIDEAFEQGAVFAFCNAAYFKNHQETLEAFNLIIVEDTLSTLQELAHIVIKDSGAKVVAVTGSTGKTTTKDMITRVLTKKYKVISTLGNFNNHIGLPLTVLSGGNDVDIFVLEMGMNHFGEIEKLVEIAQPDIALITNIGSSHIEHLGSKEGILKAKMEIMDRFKEKDIMIFNGYDPLLRRTYTEQQGAYSNVVFGELETDDYRITDIVESEVCHCSYVLTHRDAVLEISLKVPGRHNVSNSVFAAIIGRQFEVPSQKIIDALQMYHGEKMRLDVMKMDAGYTVINDAYNASIDSMKSSLEVASKYSANKRFVFLGDMLEMGEYAREGHREVADHIDIDSIDYLMTIGQLARHIGIRLLERGFNPECIKHFETFEDAGEFLTRTIQEGDLLLIKGSRGMAMETILKKI
jgi:UDP-N-acetylmuramoyl-tripeptide--D-alanyl-D-alanine ligase